MFLAVQKLGLQLERSVSRMKKPAELKTVRYRRRKD